MHALVGLSRARIEGSPQGMPWSYRWLVFFPVPFPVICLWDPIAGFQGYLSIKPSGGKGL